jgi:hypothetical protein
VEIEVRSDLGVEKEPDLLRTRIHGPGEELIEARDALA